MARFVGEVAMCSNVRSNYRTLEYRSQDPAGVELPEQFDGSRRLGQETNRAEAFAASQDREVVTFYFCVVQLLIPAINFSISVFCSPESGNNGRRAGPP